MEGWRWTGQVEYNPTLLTTVVFTVYGGIRQFKQSDILILSPHIHAIVALSLSLSIHYGIYRVPISFN